MRCVRCQIDLVPETYEGTQIDRCARCGGVWLDSGELTRIVDTIGVTLPAATIRDTLAAAFAGVPQQEQRYRWFFAQSATPPWNRSTQRLRLWYDARSVSCRPRHLARRRRAREGAGTLKHWARQTRQHQQPRDE